MYEYIRHVDLLTDIFFPQRAPLLPLTRTYGYFFFLSGLRWHLPGLSEFPLETRHCLSFFRLVTFFFFFFSFNGNKLIPGITMKESFPTVSFKFYFQLVLLCFLQNISLAPFLILEVELRQEFCFVPTRFDFFSSKYQFYPHF